MRKLGPKRSSLLRFLISTTLGTFAVVLAMLVGTLAALQTPWGSRLALRQALPKVNSAINGRVVIDRVSASPTRITASGLMVLDPEGKAVASVAMVDIRFSPRALLRHQVRLLDVRIDKPRLDLRLQEGGGSNLARALAARQPSQAPAQAKPDSGRTTWSYRLDGLVVSDGAIAIENEGTATAAPLRSVEMLVSRMHLDGNFDARSSQWLAANLDVEGEVQRPVAAPIRVSLHGHGMPNDGDATRLMEAKSNLAIGVSQAQLSSTVRLSGSLPASAVASLDRAHVAPSLLRALLPGWPLKVPVDGSARAEWNNDTGNATVAVQLDAAGARLDLDAQANLHTSSLDGLALSIRDVDLAALVDHAPASRLSLDCRAHGRGKDLGSLDGGIVVRAPRGMLDGHVAGPLRLNAEVRRGDIHLTELFLALPGATASAAGTVSVVPAGPVDLRAAIALDDLRVLSSSLSPSAQPAASGSGHFQLVAGGSLAAPSVKLAGRLVHFAASGVSVPSADISLHVPNARQPLAANLALWVPRLGLRDQHFESLRVRVAGAGPSFTARVSLAQPESVDLAVAGWWRSSHRELVLASMRVALSRATWTSQKPARLRVGEGKVQLSELVLSSLPDQTIKVTFDKTPSRLDAHLALAGLDLAGLPSRLLPVRRASGRLDADLDVHQLPSTRSLRAHVGLHEVHVGPVDGIDGVADAELAADRINADFDLRGMGAQARGKLDLPIKWPLKPATTVRASVAVSAANLQPILSALSPPRTDGRATLGSFGQRLAVEQGMSGRAEVTLDLAGTVAHPDLAASVRLAELRWRGVSVGNVQFDAKAADDLPLSARLSVSPGPQREDLGRVVLAARSRTKLAGLLDQRGFRRDFVRRLVELPVAVDAQVERLDLKQIGQLMRRPVLTGGTASLSAHLTGSARSNHGDVDVTFAGVSARGIPPTDARLHVALRENELSAETRITRRQANLVSVLATVHAPLARAFDRSQLANIPIDLHGTVGPIEWQHAGIVSDIGRPRLLHGRLVADLRVGGTVGKPQMKLVAKAPDVYLDDAAVGAGDVLVGYDGGSVSAHLNVVSADAGRFLLDAATDLDLGYPALVNLPAPERLPVRVRVRANDFDLSPLSGWSPFLRTVAGRLAANLDVSGTLADPRPSGSFEWKQGRLAVVGMGDYEDVHLLTHGDRDRLVLDELRANSGRGHARVTAVASHQASGGYLVESRLDVDKLPVYVEGQVLANVSLNGSATSELAVRRLRSQIKLTSARVALTDAKRKHLQSLSAPGDVILVDQGAPTDKSQARKLSKVDNSLERRTPSPAKPAEDASAGTEPFVVLAVDAPRDVWLVAKDANIEIGFVPGFRVELANAPRVYGQIMVKRGYVDVVGRRFQFKETSKVQFSGQADLPTLDVTAQYVSDTENVTVVANIKGAPGHLQIALTAPDRPDLTESQLYTLVVTGHSTFGGGASGSSSPASQAESVLGGLLASQLQTLFSNKLPFDVLTVQAGATPGSARVEAGKYLTSDFYVGYVGRIGADPTLLQNRNAVHFEYDLGSRWSFQGEYGDAKTGTLDLYWTKRY